MQHTFTIQQDLTQMEFMSATLYYYLTGKWVKRFFFFLFFLSLMSVLLGFITAPLHFNSLSFIRIFAPIGILFVLLLFFIVFSSYSIFTRNAYLFKNVTYSFNDWGLIRHGEQTDFSEPWNEALTFKETKAFFIFYIGNTDFHIIQKRLFHDKIETDHFRSFIQLKCLKHV